MGKRGPKPKSNAEKLLAGNPGKRPLPAEPSPALGRPVRPEWLLPQAVEKWDELVPQLEEMGVLAVIDGHALAIYCQCYARWLSAEQFMTAHGVVAIMRNDKGEVKSMTPAAEFFVATKMLEKLNQLGMQFGLSPAARGRLSLPKAEQATVDPKAEFFGVVG